MAWKPINLAPRDGSWVMLGHVDHLCVEFHARWGVHRQSGVTRWVDGNGNGLFAATHWDYPPEPPQRHQNNDSYADGA